MSRRRMALTIDQARPATKQHTKPCSDCPWRKDSLNGWLGGLSPDDWIAIAHGEQRIDCHTRKNTQCAGAATYRANVCKKPIDPSVLLLPTDRERSSQIRANSKNIICLYRGRRQMTNTYRYQIRDTVTGETRTGEEVHTHQSDDPLNDFYWLEGSMSCDCNRKTAFHGERVDDDPCCNVYDNRYVFDWVECNGVRFIQDDKEFLPP